MNRLWQFVVSIAACVATSWTAGANQPAPESNAALSLNVVGPNDAVLTGEVVYTDGLSQLARLPGAEVRVQAVLTTIASDSGVIVERSTTEAWDRTVALVSDSATWTDSVAIQYNAAEPDPNEPEWQAAVLEVTLTLVVDGEEFDTTTAVLYAVNQNGTPVSVTYDEYRANRGYTTGNNGQVIELRVKRYVPCACAN